MSSNSASIPVYIDRTFLTAEKITSVSPSVFVFRARNNIGHENSLHSVCELIPPIDPPLPATASAPGKTSEELFNEKYQCVGLLKEFWHEKDLPDKLYSVAPNGSYAVPVLLRDKEWPKINFGTMLYVTKMDRDEIGIPKHVFVAHTENVPGATVAIAGYSGEYNLRSNRTTQMDLNIQNS